MRTWISSRVLLLLAGSLPVGAWAASFGFDEVLKVERPLAAEVSPDGKSVLYATSTPASSDAAQNYYVLDLRSRKSRRLALPGPTAEFRLSSQLPVWRQDQKGLFVLGRAGKRDELFLAEQGGEAGFRQISGQGLPATLAASTVINFEVSPDGARVALARMFDEPKPFTNVAGRVVVALSEDPEFFGRPATDWPRNVALTVLDLASGIETPLVTGIPGATNLRWTPDSAHIVFLPMNEVWVGVNTASASPLRVDARSGETNEAFDSSNHIDILFELSASGDRALHVISENLVAHQRGSAVYSAWIRALQPAAREAPIKIASDFYTTPGTRRSFYWDEQRRRIYAVQLIGTTSRLVSLAAQGQSPARMLSPPGMHVTDVSFAPGGKRAIVVMGSGNIPAELYQWDVGTPRFTRLTDFAAQLRDRKMARVEQVSWRSGDGQFRVEGLLVKPTSFETGRRYPLLLYMHGGPGATWTNDFHTTHFDIYGLGPIQLFAEAGYLVLMPNPRGDRGYGRDYHAALIGNLGQEVRTDCLAGVQYLIQSGLADADRIAAVGRSYGAASAYLAAAFDPSIKAVIADDGPVNWIRYRMNNYANTYHALWPEYYLGGLVHETAGKWWEASPVRWSDLIRSPTLMRVSARNAEHPRSLMSLAEHMDLYARLKANAVPVELLAFPGEGHAIGGGEAARENFMRNLAWLDRWVLARSR